MGNVLYGQKLYIDDLFNIEWQKKFAEPSVLCSMLREYGISFIEFPIGEETDDNQILQITSICNNEGLFVSLHPYLYKSLSPEIFDENSIPELERMLATANEAGDITGVPVSYIFHGGRANWEPFNKALPIAIKHARAFFEWTDKAVTNNFTNVVPLCETQTPYNELSNGMVRLGDTYQGCLELVEGTDVGICWDFGHTFRAATLGKHEPLPGDHFLARVRHVHAHDTVETKSGPEDHYPLGDALSPWRDYCAALARHDFDDSILLEINPNRYGGLQEFLRGTNDNIGKLSPFFD